FPASGGVAHQRGVLEIQRLDDGCQIVGVAVHVVSGGGLAGPAVATPVVCDHAEAVLREEQHLAVPGVGVQRPAVRACYDRAFPPVLVIDLCAVFRGDRAHRCGSSSIGKSLAVASVVTLLSVASGQWTEYNQDRGMLHREAVGWLP